MTYRNKKVIAGDLVVYKFYYKHKENSPVGLVVEDRFADLGKVEVLWSTDKKVELLDDLEVICFA